MKTEGLDRQAIRWLMSQHPNPEPRKQPSGSARKSVFWLALLGVLLFVVCGGAVVGVVVLVDIGSAILMPQFDEAKDDADRIRAKTIAQACKQHEIDHAEMPTSVQQLTQPDPAIGNASYLSSEGVLDARKQPFQLDPRGTRSGDGIDVFTTNPKTGAVIGNWKR